LSLLVNDTVQTFLSALYALRWGIFKGGLPVIVPQSIVSLDFKQDWTILSYPVEQGGFQSYNKVQTPFEARVRMTSGAAEAERIDLLTTVAEIAGSLDLYDVVTPEFVYQSANIHHYDYQRTANAGAGMIVIDLWLTEVVVVSTTSFSNVQNPSSADPVSGGQVQPQTPPLSFPLSHLETPSPLFH
jgi:hypothetical protein